MKEYEFLESLYKDLDGIKTRNNGKKIELIKLKINDYLYSLRM